MSQRTYADVRLATVMKKWRWTAQNERYTQVSTKWGALDFTRDGKQALLKHAELAWLPSQRYFPWASRGKLLAEPLWPFC